MLNELEKLEGLNFLKTKVLHAHIDRVCFNICCRHVSLKEEKTHLPTSVSPTPEVEFNLRKISCFLDFTIGEVFSSLVKKEGR